MVCMPSEVEGTTWKFARPYHGPFRIISLTPTNAEVQLIEEPHSAPLFVSLSRVRSCFDELPDVAWKGSKPGKYTPYITKLTNVHTENEKATPYTGPITHSRTKN